MGWMADRLNGTVNKAPNALKWGSTLVDSVWIVSKVCGWKEVIPALIKESDDLIEYFRDWWLATIISSTEIKLVASGWKPSTCESEYLNTIKLLVAASKYLICVRNSFVSIYFPHFKLFLPTDTHPFTHVLTITMLLPHITPLYLISFSPFAPSPNHQEHQQSQFEHLSKTGAIYSQRSSLPSTFSHPIPYCKASPTISSNSFNNHSLTNLWWDARSQGIESKGTPNDDDPSPQDEEVTGGRIRISTGFSNPSVITLGITHTF